MGCALLSTRPRYVSVILLQYVMLMYLHFAAIPVTVVVPTLLSLFVLPHARRPSLSPSNTGEREFNDLDSSFASELAYGL